MSSANINHSTKISLQSSTPRIQLIEVVRRYQLHLNVAAVVVVFWYILGLRPADSGRSLDHGDDIRLSENDDQTAQKTLADFITRDGYFRPPSLCDLSEEAIQVMLATAHNCSRHQPQVWLEGEWITAFEMRSRLKVPATNPNDTVVCGVFCAEKEFPCYNNKCLFSVHMRRDSTDPMVAVAILVDGGYDFLRPSLEIKTILDGGGNCGFPKATIVSVEPSRGNYEMLRMNTKVFRNVLPVHSALWNRVTTLAMTNGAPKDLEWAFMVQEKKDVPVGTPVIATMQGVSVPFLLDIFGLDAFHMLKVDIEGSEKELLSNSTDNDMSWLEHAKMAMIETHEDMRPGSHAAVADAFRLRANTWKFSHKDTEYDVYKRIGFDEQPDPPA